MYNLGQKIVDRFRKLSKIVFYMKQFTAHFSRFSSINNALLQLEQLLVPNLYLSLKCKIVFFDRYHTQVFFATELPEISIWRANGAFQIAKLSESVKPRGLDWIINKNTKKKNSGEKPYGPLLEKNEFLSLNVKKIKMLVLIRNFWSSSYFF